MENYFFFFDNLRIYNFEKNTEFPWKPLSTESTYRNRKVNSFEKIESNHPV